ncbi:ABC transporter permease subunit [Weissella coleopterorum]|uniref:ABC transporter permease subunit n=1 Tax=Weissella coleopterorum TaxID=2714949 RepID=A0A6G8AZM0_9LACO|nr:ABC transporter permease subunit [Weissella coleopterorum]
MFVSVAKELKKLSKRKISWISLILTFIFMLIMGASLRSEYSKLLIMGSFGLDTISPFLLILVGSTIFSMEFKNNTIWLLLYKSKSKHIAFWAKIITLFLYDILLHVVAIIYTMILSITILNKSISSWLNIYQYNEPLIINLLKTSFLDIIATMIVISFVCLLSILIKSSEVVITLSILTVFMGSGISNSIIYSYKSLMNIARWNPLNISTHLTTQYYNYNSYHDMTRLSNVQMLYGGIGYIILLLFIGFIIFRSKRF